MNKTLVPSALVLVVALTACGEEKKAENKDTAVEQVVTKKEPLIADGDMQFTDSLTLGGHRLDVTIRRYADKQLPTVKDEIDNEFYDNRVEITIVRAGEQVYNQEFAKESFASFLSAEEKGRGILVGMNVDREASSSQIVCLTAVVGAPGSDAVQKFLIKVPAAGGSPVIARDTRIEPDIYDNAE